MKTIDMKLPDHVRYYKDEFWLDLLIRSITEQKVNDISFPGFPPPEVQARFVGSSFQQTLEEAFRFYKFVKKSTTKLGKTLSINSRFLDFGCGWGRFLRFFWKDIKIENLFGCDVLPLAIDTCIATNVPGNFDLIDAEGVLPYPDNYFDGIMAYSVFTHLPEKLNRHWMRELSRVSKPGCVFCLTLEPRRFIDAIRDISPNTDSAWHRSLLRFAPLTDEYYQKFDSGEIAYLPTGGGDTLNSDIYGDAVVPLSFIEKNWSPDFVVRDYVDDLARFWQAALVVQKT